MVKSFSCFAAKRWLIALVLVLPFKAQADYIKISTWNLDWLTARTHAEANLPTDVHVRRPEDFANLKAYANKLAADIIAFQEVDGPQAASLVFDSARYNILTTDQAVTQRVGLALAPGIAVLRHSDYTPLDVEPRGAFPLRDGLDATLRLKGGHTLRVLVIHLKTGCQTGDLDQPSQPQCILLAQQIAPLANWAAAREVERVGYLILGDFNRVLDTPEPLGRALFHAAPLLRATAGFANPCWDGDPFIDHILAGGPARAWVVPGSLRVQIFHASEREKSRLSDHCPVSIRLDPLKR